MVDPPSAGAPLRPRRRLFEHPGRVATVVVILLAVLNLGIIALNTADTSPGGRDPLPSDIESLTPERGELTPRITDVVVDLRDDYTGILVIDGVEIPEDQTDRVAELGQIAFRPGPDKELSSFRVGVNTVVVRYWLRTKPRPDQPFSFNWSFRASA